MSRVLVACTLACTLWIAPLFTVHVAAQSAVQPAPAPPAAAPPAVAPSAAAPPAAAPPAAAPPTGAAAQPAPQGVTPPADYVIGPNDVLTVVFWRDESMTTDAVVRPDGMISLPLINDVQAAGLTPTELKDRVTELASKYLQSPSVTVVIKQINSRVVYISGSVGQSGTYPLMAPTTVTQLIAVAGGLTEWARQEDIVILRNENGKPLRFKFNYKWVLEGKNPGQNIELRPGDTVLVP